MAAAAHNPAFAKKVGIPTSVGKEFVQADKAKGYSTQAKINRPNTAHGKVDMPFESTKSKGGIMKESKKMVKKEIDFFKKKGAPKSMIKHEEKEAKTMKFAKGGGIESRGKTKGKIIKMAKGGRAC
jgi:hypothetical protein